MSKQVDQQGIRYDRNENSLFNISDLAKAQELANNIESLKLCGRLDAIAHQSTLTLEGCMKFCIKDITGA